MRGHPIPWRLGIVLACLVLSLAGCTAGESRSQERGDVSAARPSVDSPETEPLFLIPGDIPRSLEPIGDATEQGPESWPATFLALVGQPRAGGYSRLIRLHVSASSSRDEDPAEREPLPENSRIVQVGGSAAVLTESEVVGTSLAWKAGDVSILIVGPSQARSEVLAIARGLSVPASENLEQTEIGVVPEGYELLLGHASPSFRVDRSYTLTLREHEPRALASIRVMQLSDDGSPPPPVGFTVGTDRLTMRVVRGADAAMVFDSTSLAVESRSVSIEQFNLAWFEHPNVLVTIQAANLTEAEVISLAEGLRSTSEETWRATVD